MPQEVGMQGGVPDTGQEVHNVDPFAPNIDPAVSTPEPTTVIPAGVGVPIAEVKAAQSEPEPKKNKNDETRYEYWQAQTAARDKQLEIQTAQSQQLMQQNAQMMQMLQQQQTVVPEPVIEPIKVPEAPNKPTEPRGFNREDAMTDPKSQSAIYLDELDAWRSGMDVYNTQMLDYNRAIIEQERMQVQESLQSLQSQQATQAQYAQAVQLVQAQHGLNQAQAQEFVQTYSNPESVTLDNLVNMYKIQKGLPLTAQQPVQPLAQPSPAFRQTQRAQQLAPPMGVMPAQQPASPANMGNAFMDAISSKEIDSTIFGV